MVNRNNYLKIKSFLDYLREVAQLKASSVRRYWFYLRHLLLWADAIPFGQVADLRPTFPRYLASVGPYGEDRSLAPATLKKITQTARRFFEWAKSAYPRQFGDLSKQWIDTLRPPRVVAPAPQHEFVELDEVQQLAKLEIEEGNLALRRDQAGAILLYLSAARVRALGSLPIQAVNVQDRRIKQWPSLGVRTKNDKTATTYLLEIPELLSTVARWDAYVRSRLPEDAMWYAPIVSRFGEQSLSPHHPGVHRDTAIRKRLHKLFDAADLPYKSPHKFRHGHAVYALQCARTMADYKAVSMNMMHSDITVTDAIYAPLAGDDVQERISRLSSLGPRPAVPAKLESLVGNMSEGELAQALHAIAERLAW